MFKQIKKPKGDKQIQQTQLLAADYERQLKKIAELANLNDNEINRIRELSRYFHIGPDRICAAISLNEIKLFDEMKNRSPLQNWGERYKMIYSILISTKNDVELTEKLKAKKPSNYFRQKFGSDE